jgi:protocatechuate 3,4-dioxygenase beta subunit
MPSPSGPLALCLVALLPLGVAAAPCELSGLVLRQGRPAAGATVALLSQGEAKATVRTDAKGAFRFSADALTGADALQCNHEGLVAFEHIDGCRAQLSLFRAAEVTGRVLDGERRPIAGATVAFQPELIEGDYRTTLGFTRADGSFGPFTLPARATKLLAVAPKGERTWPRRVALVQGRQAVELAFEVRPLTLEVKRADGSPAVGVLEVRLSQGAFAGTSTRPGPRVPLLVRGEQAPLLLHVRELETGDSATVALTNPVDQLSVRLEHTWAGTIVASVRNEAGAAAASLRVRLCAGCESDWRPKGPERDRSADFLAETDRQGRVEFKGVPLGSYLLSADTAMRLTVAPRAVRLKRDKEVQRVTLDIREEPRLNIAGRVVDSEGRGLPKAVVHLGGWTSTTVDSVGRFSFEKVPAAYDTSAIAVLDGYRMAHPPAQSQATASPPAVPQLESVLPAKASLETPTARAPALPALGKREFDVVMVPVAPLRGRVVDAQGAPITHFTVGRRTVESADGTFAAYDELIDSRAGGPPLVEISVGGLATVSASNPDGGTHLGDVRLEAATPLTVRVLHQDTGEPIAAAVVVLVAKEAWRYRDFNPGPFPKTNAGGAVHFPQVPRPASVIVVAEGFSGSGPVPVEGEHCEVRLRPKP